MQNVTKALQSSRQELKAMEEGRDLAEAKSKIQEKALMDNLDSMRAERDGMAELTAKLERKEESPVGVDAAGWLYLALWGCKAREASGKSWTIMMWWRGSISVLQLD